MLEEPTAGNLHGGVREGRELTGPWLTYTRTKLETADRAKEDLQSMRFSSTRKSGVRIKVVPFDQISEGSDEDRLQPAADVRQAERVGSHSGLTHGQHHTKVRS